MNVSSASLDVSDMNSLSSTWFAGDDFDLDALNSAIQESIAHYAYPMQSYPTEHRTQLPSIEHVETEGVLPTHPSLSTLYSSSISKKWFSNIEVDSEAPETRQGSQGPGSAQVDVDEAYRVNLTSKLQVRAHNESLPSTEFLVNRKVPLHKFFANTVRIFAYECISRASILYFLYCTAPHFDHQQRTHFCCYPFAPLGAYSLDQRMR
jgi:hypothetical protein